MEDSYGSRMGKIIIYPGTRATLKRFHLLPRLGDILSSNSVLGFMSTCFTPALLFGIHKYRSNASVNMFLLFILINDGFRLDCLYFLKLPLIKLYKGLIQLTIQEKTEEKDIASILDPVQAELKSSKDKLKTTVQQLGDAVTEVACLQRRVKEDAIVALMLQKELDETTADLDRERKRLNEHLQMLIRQDPNFTDINDQTRPEKIIEKFEDFRSDQRCDFYELLDDLGYNEDDQLKLACELFMVCNGVAVARFQKTLDDLLDQLNRDGGSLIKELQKSTISELKRELRHRVASKSLFEQMYNTAWREFERQHTGQHLDEFGTARFGRSSCELCWLLALSANPLLPRVSGHNQPGSPARLDLDMFEIYPDCVGKQLNSVLYTVWPALVTTDERLQSRGIAFAVHTDFEADVCSEEPEMQAEQLESEDEVETANAQVQNDAPQVSETEAGAFGGDALSGPKTKADNETEDTKPDVANFDEIGNDSLKQNDTHLEAGNKKFEIAVTDLDDTGGQTKGSKVEVRGDDLAENVSILPTSRADIDDLERSLQAQGEENDGLHNLEATDSAVEQKEVKAENESKDRDDYTTNGKEPVMCTGDGTGRNSVSITTGSPNGAVNETTSKVVVVDSTNGKVNVLGSGDAGDASQLRVTRERESNDSTESYVVPTSPKTDGHVPEDSTQSNQDDSEFEAETLSSEDSDDFVSVSSEESDASVIMVDCIGLKNIVDEVLISDSESDVTAEEHELQVDSSVPSATSKD